MIVVLRQRSCLQSFHNFRFHQQLYVAFDIVYREFPDLRILLQSLQHILASTELHTIFDLFLTYLAFIALLPIKLRWKQTDYMFAWCFVQVGYYGIPDFLRFSSISFCTAVMVFDTMTAVQNSWWGFNKTSVLLKPHLSVQLFRLIIIVCLTASNYWAEANISQAYYSLKIGCQTK